MMLLDRPAYLDHDGAVRCGLPAEVTGPFTIGRLQAELTTCGQNTDHQFGARRGRMYRGRVEDERSSTSPAAISDPDRERLPRGSDEFC